MGAGQSGIARLSVVCPSCPLPLADGSLPGSRVRTAPWGESLSLGATRRCGSLPGVCARAPCVRRVAGVCAGGTAAPGSQCRRAIIGQPRRGSKPFLGHQGPGTLLFPPRNCPRILQPIDSQGREERACAPRRRAGVLRPLRRFSPASRASVVGVRTHLCRSMEARGARVPSRRSGAQGPRCKGTVTGAVANFHILNQSTGDSYTRRPAQTDITHLCRLRVCQCCVV